MGKGFHKKQSKRIPARLRYKVEKRVKDHHRKLKKQAKKNRDPTANRKKPIAVIPNNVPFKDQIIQEARDVKAKEIERKKLLKSLLKGDIDIKTIMKDRPLIKLNAKKRPIKTKKASLTVTASATPSAETTMQCD